MTEEKPYEPPVTVGITTAVMAEDVWSAVFGAYPTYWGWSSVHFTKGDWNIPGKAQVKFWNPESGESLGEKTLTVEDVAEAINALGGQWKDLDSASSDAILQRAVLGEVVMG